MRVLKNPFVNFVNVAGSTCVLGTRGAMPQAAEYQTVCISPTDKGLQTQSTCRGRSANKKRDKAKH